MQGRAPSAIKLSSQRSPSHWAAWLGASRLLSLPFPLLRPPAVCRGAFQELGQRPSPLQTIVALLGPCQGRWAPDQALGC